MQYSMLRKILTLLTTTYLSLPILIFFGGWLRQPFSTALVVLLIVAVTYNGWRLFRYKNNVAYSDNTDTQKLSFLSITAIFLFAVVFMLYSGVGGWSAGYQTVDWYKHNAILHDLIINPWPVIYRDFPEDSLLLTYYTAYYLPAAVIGKLSNWQFANHTLFFWTLLGVCLSMLWTHMLTRQKSILIGVLFIFFSGMDVLGAILLNFSEWLHIENWSGIGQYSAHITQLLWAPHQAVAGWLLTSLVISDVQTSRLLRTGCLYLALSLLWSPFLTIGIFPFIAGGVLFEGWQQRRSALTMLKQICSSLNVVGLVIGLILLIYFVARFQPYTLPFEIVLLPKGGFGMNITQLPAFFGYVIFLLSEFLLLHLFLYLSRTGRDIRQSECWLLWIATAVLIVLPLFRYGFFNDLVMRASIPALFVTFIAVLWSFRAPIRSSRQWIIRTFIITILSIGALNALIEFRRHTYGIYERLHNQPFISMIHEESVLTIPALQYERYGGSGRYLYNFVGGYVGSPNCWFMTYLARKQAQ